MCFCRCNNEVMYGPNKGECRGEPYLCSEETLCPMCDSDNTYQIDVLNPVYKCGSCSGTFNRSETLRV